MTFSEALSAYLKAYAGLLALVKSRVYPILGRQKGEAPYIVWSIDDDDRSYSHDGFSGASETRVELSCYAATVDAAKAVAVQAVLALEAWSDSDTAIGAAFQETASDFWDDEAELFYVQVQFKVQHGY